MDDASTIDAPAALKTSGGGIPMEKIIVAIHGWAAKYAAARDVRSRADLGRAAILHYR